MKNLNFRLQIFNKIPDVIVTKSTDVYTYCSPLLAQLHYFLFGLAHTRRNNSAVCVRVGGLERGQGTAM